MTVGSTKVMWCFNIGVLAKLFLQSPLLSFKPISGVIPHRMEDGTAASSSNIFHILKTAIKSPLACASTILLAFCRKILSLNPLIISDAFLWASDFHTSSESVMTPGRLEQRPGQRAARRACAGDFPSLATYTLTRLALARPSSLKKSLLAS